LRKSNRVIMGLLLRFLEESRILCITAIIFLWVDSPS
jgi:hypothetical protein